jgi:hypothetical protein
MGLGVLFWLGFYKYAAPDGAGEDIARRVAENGNRDGALPSIVPAVRPMAVWGGRTGHFIERQDLISAHV